MTGSGIVTVALAKRDFTLRNAPGNLRRCHALRKGRYGHFVKRERLACLWRSLRRVRQGYRRSRTQNHEQQSASAKENQRHRRAGQAARSLLEVTAMRYVKRRWSAVGHACSLHALEDGRDSLA